MTGTYGKERTVDMQGSPAGSPHTSNNVPIDVRRPSQRPLPLNDTPKVRQTHPHACPWHTGTSSTSTLHTTVRSSVTKNRKINNMRHAIPPVVDTHAANLSGGVECGVFCAGKIGTCNTRARSRQCPRHNEMARTHVMFMYTLPYT